MTTVAPAAEAVEQAPPRSARPSLATCVFLASTVLAVVPVGTATARAIVTGWIPTEDNALFAIRARDLFSLTHLPLLGTWSSASLNVGKQVNHPGPLYFDLLALPARISDSGAGVALGVGLINALCIAGIAWFGYRRGGALVGTVAMAGTAALCWAMGSELLFEPWNPHSAMLPFALFLVLVWSMACGDLLAVPAAAGVGSLVMQTHLSYALLVPLLGAWGIIGLVLTLRAERRGDGVAWPSRRTHALQSGAIAVLIVVVCWLQPVIEQFTSDGTGNLTRLADSARSADADTIGYGFGARVVATVVSLPPWWFRPSLREQFTAGWHAPSLAAAVLSLAALGVVLAWCGWVAYRRRDRVSWWAIATAIVGLLVALLTAGRGPITVFGKVTPHTFRWLWPLAAFVFFAIAITIARRLASRPEASGRILVVVGAFAIATLVFAVLNVPHSDQGLGPNSQEYAIPAAHDLAQHMGSLDDKGPLLIDDLFHGAFADPYGGTAVAELQRRGIDFVAHDPVLVRQFGPARRFDGTNAKQQLLLRTGDAARKAPPGSRRVALGQGLSRADRRELARLKRDIRDYIDAGRLRLNEKGQAALAAGELPRLAEIEGGAADVQSLLDSRELDLMVRRGELVLDPPWLRRFERYADLQHRSDLETVALFLAPLP
jgi:hypothetical protein